MLLYERITGNLSRDGVRLAKCYSGNGDGLDNPEMEAVRNKGPLPSGTYTLARMTAAEVISAHKGPDVYRLVPDPANQMFGRSGFLIHWDTPAQDFLASEGCIVPVMSAVFKRLKDGEILTVK